MKSCHVKEKFLFFSLLQARTKHAKTLHWDFIGSIDGCAAFDARLLLRLSPAPICLLMTLFSSICCSRRDARFFCCLFFRGQRIPMKSFEFQEIIQHTRTTARDFQLLLNFSSRLQHYALKLCKTMLHVPSFSVRVSASGWRKFDMTIESSFNFCRGGWSFTEKY